MSPLYICGPLNADRKVQRVLVCHAEELKEQTLARPIPTPVRAWEADPDAETLPATLSVR